MDIILGDVTSKPQFLKPDLTFPWTEYIFFAAVLAASLGIGIFYGFFGKSNKTNEDFLMAGRSMSILPVALSLICSFVSAITLLGNPVEVYIYGVQYVMVAFSVIPMTLLLMYIYVPTFFKLQLTSAYEYFEWRFSRRVRVLVSAIAIFHLMFYMPTTVYGPSLALDQVAGINTMASTAAIFLVCIAYSSMGGLKAVLWTDALQAVVMLVSLVAVIAAGMTEVGGFSVMWERAKISHRTDFFNTDPDPRTRHTLWTTVIGGVFVWLPLFGATQAQIQRYNSVPTLVQSRKTLVFNLFGLILIMFFCAWIGLILYAYYFECDPVNAEIVKSTDQVLPLFVLQVLGKFPGIPGLLVAGLTCGSLSSISSALNSLTCLITEDFIKPNKPGLSEERLALISKIISGVTGILAFCLVFIVAEVNETVPIQPFSTLIHGSLLGPILAAFSLGMFFPWVEEIGVLAGFLVSIGISVFIGIGGILAGKAGNLPDQRLTLRTDGCALASTNIFNIERSDVSLLTDYIKPGDWKTMHSDDGFEVKMWSMSYMWQPFVATMLTFIVGLIVSAIVVMLKKKAQKVNESLLNSSFLNLWKAMFGNSYLERWVDFDTPPYSGDPIEKAKREEAMKNYVPHPTTTL